MKTSLELLEWDLFVGVLAAHCSSELGRERARRLRPFRSTEALWEAASAVLECGRLLEQGRGLNFGGLVGLRELLEGAHRRGTGMGGEELSQVRAVLVVAQRARQRFGGDEPFPRLRERVLRLPDLSSLVERLERTIDGQGAVLDEALPELGSLRGRCRTMEEEIRELARNLRATPSYRSVLRDGPPVMRGGRFMLAVKAESRGNVPGVLHDRSSSGATVFIEPKELVAPQNALADLRARERSLVRRILLECSREVLRKASEIQESLQILGSIDLLFARSRWGARWGARLVPVGGRSMRLIGARHPLLLEREAENDGPTGARQRVIPFDLELGGAFDLVVITGPNTGGKTATLKAIGLLAVMARCAIPLPVAEGSCMPHFDRVEADVGDEQDLQQNLSTFSGHLRRITHMLRDATAASLVLLDELGSGTDPKEGEALGDALLRHLIDRGCLGVATTHLSALKDLGYELDRVENASLEFDVETLSPLYRLTVGLPGESHALRIARRHGLPAPIVEAAKLRLERGVGEASKRVAVQVERSRRLVLDRLERVEKEQAQVELRREEMEVTIRKVEEKGASLEREKELEIERVLQEASREGGELVNRLGTLSAEKASRVQALREFMEGLPRRSELTERRQQFVLGLRRDHAVYLPRYREVCVVRKVDRKKGCVTVLYRSLPMEVLFRDIERPENSRG